MLKATLLPLALGLSITSASSALSQPSQSEAPAKPAAEIRSELIALAAQIAGASKPLSQIWPGYWPEDQAFIIHAEGVGAILVSPGPRPASFEPVSVSELPEVLKGKAYFHKGTLSGAERPFVIGYPIGEGKTALLANRTDREPDKVIALILHEQFHGFQAGAFKGREQQFVDPLAVKDRVAFAANAEVERTILAAALSAASAKKRKELIKQYFAVRREREQSIPPEVVKVEQGFERSEGTAQYADMVGRAVVTGGGEARVLSLLTEALRRKLATETGAYSTIWFRSRSYGTGAALTHLIGKFAKSSWRKQIEEGAMPDRLLEQLIGEVPPTSRGVIAEAARRQFRYEDKVRELEPMIRSAEKSEIKSVEEFLAFGSYAVVFEPGTAGASARPGFQAMNMTLLSPSVTALPLAKRFNVSSDAFNLTTSDRPVLLETGKQRRYTVLLKSAPQVEGLGTLPAGEHKLRNLKLTAEGYELKIDKPVTVRVEDKRMTVTLEE